VRPADYKPPFVYFGGKSSIADVVWSAMGDVDSYTEPFFGSGAVLFLRPDSHRRYVENVNDADGFVSNFWRALQRDPDAVAEAADWIVSECDLHARHLWLLGQRERITERLMGDPDFYDAKAAGWWCWGLNCWIGSGWCSGRGPWQSVDGVFTNTRAKENGVWAQRPHLGDAGKGVNRKLPHLGDAGKGVNRKLPHLGDAGKGECAARREWITAYLRTFADRLRGVRICLGGEFRGFGPALLQGCETRRET